MLFDRQNIKELLDCKYNLVKDAVDIAAEKTHLYCWDLNPDARKKKQAMAVINMAVGLVSKFADADDADNKMKQTSTKLKSLLKKVNAQERAVSAFAMYIPARAIPIKGAELEMI